MKCSPLKQKDRVKFEKATLRLFLKYHRPEAGAPISPPKVPRAEDLKLRYIDYLRKERGLAINSVVLGS